VLAADGALFATPTRKTKSLQTPPKEHEGHQRSAELNRSAVWSHPSHWRRSRPSQPRDSRDEHNPPGILTPDSGRTPAFPARGQWRWGACHPLQWRNRPRFSRGSLDSGRCWSDGRLARRVSKNGPFIAEPAAISRKIPFATPGRTKAGADFDRNRNPPPLAAWFPPIPARRQGARGQSLLNRKNRCGAVGGNTSGALTPSSIHGPPSVSAPRTR
jgi:hypothetical protein